MRTHLVIDKLPGSLRQPLTSSDRQTYILKVLGDRFDHKGDVFQPNSQFYQLADSSQLTDSAREILRWLGMKPTQLSCDFADLSTPGLLQHTAKATTLQIDARFRHRPYRTAAVLTHLLLHYVLVKQGLFHRDPEENERLVEQLSIETGLGLIFLNGLDTTEGWLMSLQDTFSATNQSLTEYGVSGHYVELFQDYLQRYHIHHSAYESSLTPWTARALGRTTATVPAHARQAIRHRRLNNLRHVTYATSIVLALSLCAYSLLLPPQYASNDISTQEERLRLLSERYKDCVTKADALRQSIDTTDLLQITKADGKDRQCLEIEAIYENEYRTYQSAVK